MIAAGKSEVAELVGRGRKLEHGDARCNDPLRSQALNGGLDQWQRAITFEHQREQVSAEGMQLWPTAIGESELAAQLVQVLENRVLALAVVFEDIGIEQLAAQSSSSNGIAIDVDHVGPHVDNADERDKQRIREPVTWRGGGNGQKWEQIRN
jgi:hypothetical protein